MAAGGYLKLLLERFSTEDFPSSEVYIAASFTQYLKGKALIFTSQTRIFQMPPLECPHLRSPIACLMYQFAFKRYAFEEVLSNEDLAILYDEVRCTLERFFKLSPYFISFRSRRLCEGFTSSGQQFSHWVRNVESDSWVFSVLIKTSRRSCNGY